MITWIKEHYKKHMRQALIVQTVVRTLIAVVLSLLWDRFVNTDGRRGLDMATGTFALVLLALAWFAFLSLDGVEGPFGILRAKKKEQEKKKIRRSAGGDIADHIDEEVVSFDELQEDEKKYCRLAANLLSGLILLAITGVLLLR